MGFQEIAPYLTSPLVLIGFALFLFFGALHQKFNKEQTRYGFVLALVVIVLGFTLQYEIEKNKIKPVANKPPLTTPSESPAQQIHITTGDSSPVTTGSNSGIHQQIGLPKIEKNGIKPSPDKLPKTTNSEAVIPQVSISTRDHSPVTTGSHSPITQTQER